MLAGTRVRIPWQAYNGIPTWNETCIWAMEKFGLPGDRYYTHVTADFMDFYFTDIRDAIIFELARG